MLIVEEPLHHQGVSLLSSEGVVAVQGDSLTGVGAGGGGGEDAGEEEMGDPHTGAWSCETEAEEPHVGQPHVG